MIWGEYEKLRWQFHAVFVTKVIQRYNPQTSKATLFLEVSFFNPQKQTNQTPNLRREPTGRLGNVVHSPWEKEP